MKNKKWTEEEINWLKENYQKLGARKSSVFLGRTICGIHVKSSDLKLNLSHEQLNNIRCKFFDFDYWTNLNNAYICYLLGFFWADGCLTKTEFRFVIVKDDFENINHFFKNAQGWNFREQIFKKKKGKPQSIVSTKWVQYRDFLKSFDYHIKSGASADKILAAIPEQNRHYWWRGFMDGDGCFYLNKARKHGGFCFAGPYEQNWDFVKNLFEILDLNFKIIKNLNKNKGHKHSEVRCNKYLEVVNFGDYIYQGEIFGLKRKYEKFLNIKQNAQGREFQFNTRKNRNPNGFVGVSYNKQLKKFSSKIRKHPYRFVLGFFSDPEDAARAYDKKAKELFRDKAILNFPDQPNNPNDITKPSAACSSTVDIKSK